MVMECRGVKFAENAVLLSRFAAVILEVSGPKPNLEVIVIVSRKALARASNSAIRA